MPDPEFASFQAIDDFVAEKRGVMIDLNTERIQMSRVAIQEIEKLRIRFNEEQQELADVFNEACDDIIAAHAVGARMSADFTADMIMEEFNIQQADGDAEEPEDDSE